MVSPGKFGCTAYVEEPDLNGQKRFASLVWLGRGWVESAQQGFDAFSVASLRIIMQIQLQPGTCFHLLLELVMSHGGHVQGDFALRSGELRIEQRCVFLQCCISACRV